MHQKLVSGQFQCDCEWSSEYCVWWVCELRTHLCTPVPVCTTCVADPRGFIYTHNTLIIDRQTSCTHQYFRRTSRQFLWHSILHLKVNILLSQLWGIRCLIHQTYRSGECNIIEKVVTKKIIDLFEAIFFASENQWWPCHCSNISTWHNPSAVTRSRCIAVL